MGLKRDIRLDCVRRFGGMNAIESGVPRFQASMEETILV